MKSEVMLAILMLQNKGYEAYIVGGCVRDMIIGSIPHDYDITTNAKPEEIMEVFNKFPTIPIGMKYGTIVVVMFGFNIEITTYRIDGNYTDSRRPDSVEFTDDIVDDLSRRDFTINAMAFDPVGHTNIDPFDGMDDIRKKVIRCVGNPSERFKEDALRMLRAFRFAGTLGFAICDETFDSIKENAHLITNISSERIRDEILKLLDRAEFPSINFYGMYIAGILQHILPELCKCYGVEQPPMYHTKDVFGHTMDVIDKLPTGDPILRMAALLHDIGKPRALGYHRKQITFRMHSVVGGEMSKEILHRLMFPNINIKKITKFVLHHDSDLHNEMKRSSIRKLIRNVGDDDIESFLVFKEADIIVHKNPRCENLDGLRKEIEEMREEDSAVIKLKVNGRDVMRVLGIEPGKQVGTVLSNLMEIVSADPTLNNETDLIRIIKEMEL